MEKGLNLQNIKQVNRSSVLYILNKYKALSRKQIAEYLGLTKAAVTKITQSLLLDGFIEEKELVSSGVGRKEILISLKFNDSCALGITFERDVITLSIASLDGILKDKLQFTFTDNFNLILNKIKKYYSSKKEEYIIIGVGVSIIGSKDNYGFFNNLNIEQELGKFIELPIFIKNNVQAFSIAEIIYGDKATENNVSIFKWGPGIGSSFIKDGKVLSGNDFGNTEIGHMIVKPNGKPCRCGRHGCLETETALDVIEQDINSLGYSLSIEEILNSENENIINVLNEKITMVCYALLNACTILNANHVILFGSMFSNDTFKYRFINKWNEISNPLKIAIDVSNLNNKSCYIGSTAIVAKKLFFEKVI